MVEAGFLSKRLQEMVLLVRELLFGELDGPGPICHVGSFPSTGNQSHSRGPVVDGTLPC